ncbi:MAG: hypothetical protein CM1200mP41_04950 [Gammaproteobacteria bacterium]|nr:MAG: hypothetical protein CM1200mP41_04950 [Gammaproteobacteria bacterium]
MSASPAAKSPPTQLPLKDSLHSIPPAPLETLKAVLRRGVSRWQWKGHPFSTARRLTATKWRKLMSSLGYARSPGEAVW